MTTLFLTHLNDNENLSKEQIQRKIENLFEIAKKDGLSSAEIKNIANCLVTVDLNKKIFEGLVYCMIPNEVVSPDIIETIMLWILQKRLECDKEAEYLLFWILCLLDYQLVPVGVVNEYYDLIWPLLYQYLPLCCHLLYILTEPEDVIPWRIELLQSHLIINSSPHLIAVLNHFKELNSKFANIVISTHQKSEKVFKHKSHVYRQIRTNLSCQLSSTALHSASIVIPQVKKSNRTNCSGQNGLLPRAQYLNLCSETLKLSQVYVHEIKNGSQLAKNFHKITLPSHTLSMLGDTLGVHVLMFSRKSVQEQFIRNLHAVLEQNLIYRPKVAPQEVEELLNKVIHLHNVYQRGFLPISNLLSLYLQFWDGNRYKNKIYKLIEWFVFKSAVELNRFLLRPLHTLFVSSDSNGKCDILSSLGNLIMNLYSTMSRCDQKCVFLYEENILRSRVDLLPVLKSLTKFMAELFKMGLYAHPCDNQILLVAIAFYEKINYFERLDNVSWWTIVPSNVLYHCLFSFNAQLMNQICLLFTNYNLVARLPVAQSTNKIQEKVRRLQSCYQDIYNILWSARAFVDRTDGHIFRGLSVEDEGDWRNYANLNNSLSVEKHIMMAPYRMMNAFECKKSHSMPKEETLDLMRNHTPHLIKFIEALRKKLDEADDEDEDY